MSFKFDDPVKDNARAKCRKGEKMAETAYPIPYTLSIIN
jgi:hypothetical protein